MQYCYVMKTGNYNTTTSIPIMILFHVISFLLFNIDMVCTSHFASCPLITTLYQTPIIKKQDSLHDIVPPRPPLAISFFFLPLNFLAHQAYVVPQITPLFPCVCIFFFANLLYEHRFRVYDESQLQNPCWGISDLIYKDATCFRCTYQSIYPFPQNKESTS